jgi:hypothetical protein
MSRLTKSWPVLIVLMAGSSLAGAADKQAAEKKDETALNELSMETTALQMLYEFKITPEQLERIRSWAKETTQKPRRRTAARASDEFRDKLLQFRNALVDDDQEQIEERFAEIEQLREAEMPELDDGVDITPAARRRVPELLRLLTPTQVAFYISENAEGFTDPFDRLMSGMEAVRGLKGTKWKDRREEIAEEVSRLLAGLDEDKAEQFHDRVLAFLIKAHRLNDAAFARQQSDLEKEARQLVGAVGVFQILRNQAEIALGEMLSNPRLPAALAARSK